MKIAIRVDASKKIGTGHFMRCFTLGVALQKQGHFVRIVSRYMPEHLIEMITNNGLDFKLMNFRGYDAQCGDLAHSSWLGVSQEVDAKDTLLSLNDKEWDCVVVDHYALDMKWEKILRESIKFVFVIDDLADRRHECDVLLDQNLYSDMKTRYVGKVPSHCKLLLGPNFALLRDDFLKMRKDAKLRDGNVNRLLVFFGGIDANNYTGQTINALVEYSFKELKVDVVLGRQHQYLKEIKAVCEENDFNCFVETNRMAELMLKADMAIGAGGISLWERCCLGLPTLVVSTAENQYKQLVDSANDGLVYFIEDKTDFIEKLNYHLRALIENNYLRKVISSKSLETVDGRGLFRIMKSLTQGSVKVKVATMEDAKRIFQWRNHSDIRKASKNKNEISWDEHFKWFTKQMQSDHCVPPLIGYLDDIAIGAVRFDIKGDRAEVSIYLAPEKLGSGLGGSLLRSAELWLAENSENIIGIHANVLGENERSGQMFLNSGYHIESVNYLKVLQ